MTKSALSQAFVIWFLAITCAASPAAFAQEEAAGRRGLRLTTEALTVENRDGDPLYQFARFQVIDDGGYTVEGARGTYESSTETLRAWGDASQMVKIAKEGEQSFTITASQSLEVRFASESLRAEGKVEYRGSGATARAELLLVDEWQRLRELVESLLDSVADEESRALVEAFFSGLEPTGRLFLMIGGVEIEREDAQLAADWAAFTEDDERFVSAGGRAPIELRLDRER